MFVGVSVVVLLLAVVAVALFTGGDDPPAPTVPAVAPLAHPEPVVPPLLPPEREPELQAEPETEPKVQLPVEPPTAATGAFLSVSTSPPGAEVLIDGVLLGRTPLRAAKVRMTARVVTLRLADHVDAERSVALAAGAAMDLGEVALVPWPVVDLAQIGDGVSATVDGAPHTGRVVVRPGPTQVLLARDGFASQPHYFDAVPAGETVVRPLPWEDFQARLDLTGLPGDAAATIDGRTVSGTATFAETRDVDLDVVRPGYGPQRITVAVALGRTVALPVIAWEALTGTLDLSAFPADATVELDGAPVPARATLAPGTYALRVRRDGYETQEMSVTIVAGQVTAPTPRNWSATAVARRLVDDLTAWDAATSGERRAAAEAVARRDPQFQFVDLTSFSCGALQREVALFRHEATELEFVLVPGGTFDMSGTDGEPDEAPVHTVALTPFLIARTECTQAAWDRVGGSDERKWRDPKLPIEGVSWDDCATWCSKAGLQLPTEAQWEFACRAGGTSRWSHGDDERRLADLAWTSANARRRTHPAGAKSPNAFGLLDVHGNVWEFVADWFGSYRSSAVTDPAGPPSGTQRVARGGRWANLPLERRRRHVRGQSRSGVRSPRDESDGRATDGHSRAGRRHDVRARPAPPVRGRKMSTTTCR